MSPEHGFPAKRSSRSLHITTHCSLVTLASSIAPLVRTGDFWDGLEMHWDGLLGASLTLHIRSSFFFFFFFLAFPPFCFDQSTC